MHTSSPMQHRSIPLVLNLLTWLAAFYTAYVFIPADIGKFGAKPFPVHLFTILTNWLHFPGYEAQFRIFTASCEVLATVLILLPWTRLYGALLTFCIMSGAIFFHVVSPLGLDPAHDGGHLFMRACLLWAVSVFVIWVRRHELSALVAGSQGRSLNRSFN